MTKNELNDAYITMCESLDPVYAGTAKSAMVCDLAGVENYKELISLASDLVCEVNDLGGIGPDDNTTIKRVYLSWYDDCLYINIDDEEDEE
tara:strand:+ start:68 stop:340 length:273 start_codon:yes stop_codon:yes gene_type:complete